MIPFYYVDFRAFSLKKIFLVISKKSTKKRDFHFEKTFENLFFLWE